MADNQYVPVDWNIIIAGAWNIAILTPEGVAKRLFELAPDTPIEIQVAVDTGSPMRIKHNNIMVQPSPVNLAITPIEPTIEQLVLSANIGKNALDSLPETPLSAAGVNFRFKFPDIPDAIIDLEKSLLDDKFIDSDLEMETIEKTLKRKIVWRNGVLNLDIHEGNDSSALIIFNYHLGSTSSEELKNWLNLSNEMYENANEIITLLLEE